MLVDINRLYSIDVNSGADNNNNNNNKCRLINNVECDKNSKFEHQLQNI